MDGGQCVVEGGAGEGRIGQMTKDVSDESSVKMSRQLEERAKREMSRVEPVVRVSNVTHLAGESRWYPRSMHTQYVCHALYDSPRIEIPGDWRWCSALRDGIDAELKS